MNLSYCPPNSSVLDFWFQNGVSPCFLISFSSFLIGAFSLLFGLGQLVFYKKYGTRVFRQVLHLRKLYVLQIIIHNLLLLHPIIQFIVIASNLLFDEIYGFEISWLISQLLSWSISCAVLMVERHYQLPTPPSNRHGIVLLVNWTLNFMTANLFLGTLNSNDWWIDCSSFQNKIKFAFWASYYILTLSAFVIGLKAPGVYSNRDYTFYRRDDEEEESFSRSNRSTWRNLGVKAKLLFPYMWPKRSIALQLNVLLSLGCLIGVRISNVYAPIYQKEIVNKLVDGITLKDESTHFPWEIILVFITIKCFQGGGLGSQGILNNLRSYLWIRVQQYTSREIQRDLFSHLHSLSLRWHLSRKTGEVLRIMDRGTSSINGLLSYIFFSIVPALVDILIAVIYFTTAFNIYFGIIVFITMFLYLLSTALCTEWRTEFRRSMNEKDNHQRTVAVDSLLNFETVKYYGAEKYEIKRYNKAILEYQNEEYKSLASLVLLNVMQTLIINIGLLAGSLYCASLVAEKKYTVGDYILFGSYMVQLMAPLNWMGTLYRAIQESFINMENMFDLMNEKPEVFDVPEAIDYIPHKGLIEFQNVFFSYSPEKPILKDVSFVVNPGETLALVGPSGSGKSTIVRLIFRFYEVQSGAILLDKQNIAYLTQESLRKNIGVVPQDTVLFNESIYYNIKYGKIRASDEEVEEAAKQADIHSKILTFTDKYETQVGERGLKLSGGEKQRVAIARTLLKSPQIILLDEATSALDTNTEKAIQKSFTNVLQNRTSIVVAHRLSTIMGANLILVLKDGEIVEKGTHDELLNNEGLYQEMWLSQLDSSDH